MKRIGSILILVSLLVAGACTRTPVPANLPTVRLTASVPGDTRGTVTATEAEKAIHHVDWFAAGPDGKVVSTRGEDRTELFRLAPGEYRFMAVANLPADAPAVGEKTIEQYREDLQVSFEDSFGTGTTGFVMTSPLVAVDVTSDADVRLEMSRVAAKVEMTGSVTFDLFGGASTGRLVSIFVTNIPATVGVCTGRQSGSGYVNDAYERSRFIPAYVTEAGVPTAAMNAHTKWTGEGEKVFYAHPNAAEQASGVEGSDHVSKLVIAAAIDGKINYYPIALPGLAANKIIRVSDVVIRGFGSDDPNHYVQDKSGLAFVVTELIPWHENSSECVLERKH